jgi:hypothetical protein
MIHGTFGEVVYILQLDYNWGTRNELGNMRRVQLGQNLYFLLNIFYLVFSAFEIYDLYSNSLLCTFVVAAMRLKNERSVC